MSSAKKRGTFRAFKNKNYRLFFCGQSVSQIGTWMQRTAVSWMIYSLTQSPFMLGLAVFAQQFPSFLFSLYGGIISDRYNKHKILLVTQTASMIQSILLAVLVLSKHYVIWEILSLSVLLGIINAFDTPARQPMVHDLVNDKDDIANALALNSAMTNMASLIGPAIAGVILQSFGAGVCFALNSVSFMAVITSLLLMKLPKFTPPTTKKKTSSELSEGLRYLVATPSISLVILLLIFMSLFVLPYNTLIPVFAKLVFKGDATTFGYITSFIGLGAIIGSLFLASLKKGTDLNRILLISIVILGIGLICFSISNSFYKTIPFAILIGIASLIPMTAGITLIQMKAAPSMRGRVMSYIAMAYFGMLPLGSLLTGSVSQKITAPTTMLYQGIMSFIIAIVFYRFLKKAKTDKKKIQQSEEVPKEALTGSNNNH